VTSAYPGSSEDSELSEEVSLVSSVGLEEVMTGSMANCE